MSIYIDALVDGLYTAAVAISGYMVAQGGPVIPSRAAVLVSLVAGAIGALNQLRGLRKRV